MASGPGGLIQRGETLYSISRRYNVDTRSLAVMNGLQKPWTVYPGDELLLPPVDEPPPETTWVPSGHSATSSALVSLVKRAPLLTISWLLARCMKADMAARVLAWFASGDDRPLTPLPELTDREREILGLTSLGLSNPAIAERLFLSHRTVGGHLHRAFPKLGVSTRAALRDALETLPPEQRPPN